MSWINDVVQDLPYGLRMLRKSPNFTIVALFTLSLGIGASTAVFSVVNQVLLNPLPYPNPKQLVFIAEKHSTPVVTSSESSISYPDFLDWVRNNDVFNAIAAYRPDDVDMTGSGEAERLTVMQVSADFFSLLGVKPIIGRNFSPSDDQRGAKPVVILGNGFWRTKFGASPEIVGKTLTLGGTDYLVVGILSRSFYFAGTDFHVSDIYTPIGAWSNASFYDRKFHMGTMAVGRLRTGVTIRQARADMETIARNLAAAYPDVNKGIGIVVLPLKDDIVQHIQAFLLLLLAAVGFVLLIACANVANLLMARSTVRIHEFTVRTVLGATRERVIRQLLTETVLLALVGGAAGFLFAVWGTGAALRVLPAVLPRMTGVHVDARLLLFAFGVSAGTGVLFGLAPALRTPNLYGTLKEVGRGTTGVGYRTQRIFVTAQVALAVLLLVGAGLTIRSLILLWNVKPGFDPRNVMSLGVAFPPSITKGSPSEILAKLRQLAANVRSAPGAVDASLADSPLPMAGDSELPFWPERTAKPASLANMSEALLYLTGPDYLNVMRIPLLQGRFITENDDAHSGLVAVIDEDFARQYFPNQSPMGQHLNLAILNEKVEIVGIVGHVKQWGLDKDSVASIRNELYLPLAQMPDMFLKTLTDCQVVVRTRTSHYPVTEIRHAIEEMDSQQVTFNFETMDEIISDSLAARRFTMILLAVFAVTALLLAAIGIYGVVSYVSEQRTHEIGIRLAMGARPKDILTLILGQGAKLAFAGVALGLVAAVGVTRFLKSLLFGVSAMDPLTLVAVSVLLITVALVACYVPARRAMRIDPAIALHHE